MMKLLALFLLVIAAPAFAQQVPTPINAPASVTSGHALCATANPQQAADCGVALGALASLSGSAQGQIVYWNGTSWALLATGAAGQRLTTQGSGANPIWSTAPLGPGYVSGTYYVAPAGSGTTSALGAANTLIAVPFYASTPQTFTKISIDVTGGASGNCELGVYNNSNGVPGSLLLDAGNVSVASAGIQEIAGLSIPLAQGWYWLAVGCNATPTLETAVAVNPTEILYFGTTNFAATFVSYSTAWTYAANALPSSFGATPTTRTTSAYGPFLALRF